MSGKIKIILLLFFCMTVLQECQLPMIPGSYMPGPEESTVGITGSWIVLNTHNETLLLPDKIISGELIAIQSDTVYLLTDVALIGVNRNMISSAVLYLFRPQSATAPMIAMLSILPSIFGAIAKNEGAFLILGVPVIITGVVMGLNENDGYVMKYPAEYQFGDLKKFARYPQGLPSGLDPEKLRLK